MSILTIFLILINAVHIRTRMHSSRMRIAHRSSHHGGVSTHPWSRPPMKQIPLEQAPPGAAHPGCGPGETQQSRQPTWVWIWRPPRCGPGDPPGQTHQLPPWVWAWKPVRHAGIPPETCCKACWDTTCNACWDTTPSPVNRITDTCKNITLPQLRCGR